MKHHARNSAQLAELCRPLAAAGHIYDAMLFHFAPGIDIAEASQLLILVAIAAAWSVWGCNSQEAHQDFQPSNGWSALVAAAFGACLSVMAGGRSSPFLYFQF